MKNTIQTMSWKISVPIFRNSIILKQLGIAIGLPFSIIIAVILISSGFRKDTLYAVGLILGLIILTILFVQIFYRGRYDAEFELSDQGILCRTQKKQAEKNKKLNTLTTVLGLLTGKPAVSGAAILAQSRQEVLVKWKHIRKVTYRPAKKTIMIYGGFAENIAVFCTLDNYELVAGIIRDHDKVSQQAKGK
ncbi:MAG: hypothetical protein PHT89_01935 [Lachnospiraceae bacterium]|nr:hypothetical protein [Lachnospiraceae bacterium]